MAKRKAAKSKKKAGKKSAKTKKKLNKRVATKKKAKKQTKKKTKAKSKGKKSKKKSTKKTAKKSTKKAAKKISKKSSKPAGKKPAKVAAKSKVKKSSDKLEVIQASVAIGDKVPNFKLPATGSESMELEAFKNKKVVLFFYPKDSTPGCTLEGQEFTQLHDQFKEKNTEVFGVSRDSIKSHENFKSKQNYSVDLISDAEETLCNIFGVMKLKNMYGREVRGIERSTFVIDESGKLIKEWRGVSVPGHAQEVLDFVSQQA